MPVKRTFKKSKKPCLYIDSSGVYYAIVRVSGKIKKRSLKTDDYGQAARDLPGVLDDLRQAPPEAGRAGSLQESLEEQKARTEADPTIGEDTEIYYTKSYNRILKTCPARVLGMPLEKVTGKHLEEWRNAAAKKYAPSTINGQRVFLNKTFAHAKEVGQIRSNPIADVATIPGQTDEEFCPTKEEFAAVVENVRNNELRLDSRGRCTGFKHCKTSALVVEFYAYSGLRPSEGKALTWGNITETHLRCGTAKRRDGRAKGFGQFRSVPLSEKLSEVLNQLRQVPGAATGPNDEVLPVKSVRKALVNACERLGIGRITHKTLRHMFVTRCIESRVPCPTVAKWLGHQDGGRLVQKTYNHVLDDHSAEQMRQVTF